MCIVYLSLLNVDFIKKNTASRFSLLYIAVYYSNKIKKVVIICNKIKSFYYFILFLLAGHANLGENVF